MKNKKYPDFSGGWNYRVIIKESSRETYAGIHEVYYNKDGEPNGWSEDPVCAYGEESESGSVISELRDDLKLMMNATEKDPLYLKDLLKNNDSNS